MEVRIDTFSTLSAAEHGVFEAAPVPVRQAPFEHVVVENFLARGIYDELVRTFPACPPCTGPTGYSLYWGDPGYEELIARSASWRALFEATHSSRFVAYCVSTFGPAAR